jgi:tetratricopeptide (TPR) repeat protein
MQAHDLWQYGRALLHIHTEENNAQARALFIETIKLDNNFARAYGHLSYTYVRAHMYGWDRSRDPSSTQKMALDLANEASRLDHADYDNYWSQGVALLWNDRHREAVDAYAEARSRNPYDADLLASMSDALVAVGDAAKAVDQTQRAIALNPNHAPWYVWNLGFAYFILGEYDLAIHSLLPIVGQLNASRIHLAASYALRDRVADPALDDPGDAVRAREEIRELLAREPQWTRAIAERQPLASTVDKNQLSSALQKAGLPD